MKLTYEDLVDKHKNKPCVVALHGPSISPYIEKIEKLQAKNEILRISTNEWFDFFKVKPDYWVVSNGEFNIKDSILNTGVWDARKYPRDVFNKYEIPLLYNKTADLVDLEFVEKNLKCDYFPYDTRHFKGHTCREILQNFRKHHAENNNFDFDAYGNNTQMWQPPDVKEVNEHCAQVHGVFAAGWSRNNKCCNNLDTSLTVQEFLQNISGHSQHFGVGQTVGMFCIAFAIIMGCDPIYVAGLDLDYSLGYAKGKSVKYGVNLGNLGHWKHVFRDTLIDDMRILRESAELTGSRIINLNHNAWYDSFEQGDL